jgi:serine/threonine protein kinase
LAWFDRAAGGPGLSIAYRRSDAGALPKSLFGYDVIARLGEGAASIIYAVSDPRSGQVYALKHVRRRSAKDTRFIVQLINEFEVCQRLSHPGLRRVIDLKISRSLLMRISEAALIMEMVDGTPLDQQKPQELPQIIDCFMQTARALSAMHYQLYVHCDLKPNNILTDAQGRVKLIDFGQAVKTGTIKERIQGTPDFIAPEQVRLKPVTFRTDVFNFGATLYWALSGQKIPTLFTVPKRQRDVVLECRFPSPRDLNPAVPRLLSDLVMQCVRVDPLHRPRDMGEILNRLDSVNL